VTYLGRSLSIINLNIVILLILILNSLSNAQIPLINPPTANDTCFVVDEGPFLDTDCLFRDDGPIKIQTGNRRFAAGSQLHILNATITPPNN
jgi:hypothetical protein